jgi:TPR repeat protein
MMSAAVREWTQQGFDYLRDAVRQGYRPALIELQMAYSMGNLVPHDIKTSLRYAAVLAAAEKGDPTGSASVRKLSAELTPDDAAEAIAQGQALAQECCSTPADVPG